MINKGIIVSVQNYPLELTQQIANMAIAGNAVGIRTDQPITIDKPLIGLKKIKGVDPKKMPFITTSLTDIKEVSGWANLVAIDYRRMNERLEELSDYCKENGVGVVADIGEYEDYENIKKKNLYYTYIATTLSVFYMRDTMYKPDLNILFKLNDAGEKAVIAEGNFSHRGQVRQAYSYCNNICIGRNITDIEALTKKYTSVRFYV